MKDIVNPPEFVLIAGPNGAGKTTTASQFLKLGAEFSYINADEIYKSIALGNVKSNNLHIWAGKIAITRAQYCITNRQSFAMETTLSGKLYLHLIQKAKQQRFNVKLFYVYLDTPELAVNRVKSRVKSGGHDIPVDVIKRRYDKSLYNLINVYISIVNEVVIVNNTQYNKKPLPVYVKNATMVLIKDSLIWEKIKEYKK